MALGRQPQINTLRPHILQFMYDHAQLPLTYQHKIHAGIFFLTGCLDYNLRNLNLQLARTNLAIGLAQVYDQP